MTKSGGIGDPKTVKVGGFPFRVATLDQAAQEVIDLALQAREGARGVPIRLANAYSVALASTRHDYGEVLRGEGINYPDGQPVAWVERRVGAPEAEQVRGPALFERVLELGVAQGLKHYMYGTTEETLALLEQQLTSRFPGVQIVGLEAPAFAPVDELASPEVAERIKASGADVLWLGLGTPKQDLVAVQLAERVGLPTLGVGAAFDFSAGTLDVAPEVLRKYGLEWCYRLAKEPRRLWKRYLVGNTQFIRLATRDLLAHRRGRR